MLTKLFGTPGQPQCFVAFSRTGRTARSRISEEFLFVVLILMLDPSQEVEAPANQVRFRSHRQLA